MKRRIAAYIKTLIILGDVARNEIIAWLTKLIKGYSKDKKVKGLYFGCVIIYLIGATFNKLSKKDIKRAIV